MPLVSFFCTLPKFTILKNYLKTQSENENQKFVCRVDVFYSWALILNKSKCPLKNKCLSNNVLYKANITSASENYRNKIYYGISETKFKSRYANHRKSFKNRNYKTDTELSNEIWKLKEQNKIADISWEILGIHQSYDTSTKRCMLCRNEKLVIALQKM